MRTSPEVKVKPEVLRWARESMARSLHDVARCLKISEATLLAWESGEARPSFAQLKDLAGYLKRPVAALFLSKVPLDPAKPADFRTLPPEMRAPFSVKTLLALRRARWQQCVYCEICEGDKGLQLGSATMSQDVVALADHARLALGVPIQKQIEWHDEVVALHGWKQAIEQQGILIIEVVFPLAEGRAFCFADADRPLIALNSADALHGKMFSLMHEYGHLMLGVSGICDMSEEGKAVEQFCNRFAGEVLVPQTSLMRMAMVSRNKDKIWTEATLSALSNCYKVSREVILRRLLIVGCTTHEFYEEKRNEWQQELISMPKPVRKRPHPAKACVRRNGLSFTATVLDAAQHERITYRDVAEYLSLDLKHLPRVETLVREENSRYA
jgi:Zn-dependent peptidase ImmA (M78 family)/transcriptional regulator with XRE-family HTH domain